MNRKNCHSNSIKTGKADKRLQVTWVTRDFHFLYSLKKIFLHRNLE
nr:MAG TPA: hypothetical protein [Caudoviricetes sp.]